MSIEKRLAAIEAKLDILIQALADVCEEEEPDPIVSLDGDVNSGRERDPAEPL